MRIAIIDRHIEAGQALAAAIAGHTGARAECVLDRLSRRGLTRLRASRPDAVLVDTHTVAPADLRVLRLELPGAKLIGLAINADAYEEAAFRSSGAQAYLEKNGSLVRLLAATLSPPAESDRQRAEPVANLTPRRT
jgi:hypothetical protein